MSNIDATTPQLKLVKDWLGAYSSRDLRGLQPYVSKNVRFQTFPLKMAKLPDESPRERMEKYMAALSLLTNLDVRIQRRGTAFKLLGSYPPPLGPRSRSDRSTGESCPPSSSLFAGLVTPSQTITRHHNAGFSRVLYRRRQHARLRFSPHNHHR
jgi:hypothetical protein